MVTQAAAPLVISWFVHHSNYSHLLKPKREIEVIKNTNLAMNRSLGQHLVIGVIGPSCWR